MVNNVCLIIFGQTMQKLTFIVNKSIKNVSAMPRSPLNINKPP
jgi:hypothetical protein